MEALPRDLQLRIVQRFDMDARIKAGVVGRLRVPAEVAARLAARPQPRPLGWPEDRPTMRLDLGSRAGGLRGERVPVYSRIFAGSRDAGCVWVSWAAVRGQLEHKYVWHEAS